MPLYCTSTLCTFSHTVSTNHKSSVAEPCRLPRAAGPPSPARSTGGTSDTVARPLSPPIRTNRPRRRVRCCGPGAAASPPFSSGASQPRCRHGGAALIFLILMARKGCTFKKLKHERFQRGVKLTSTCTPSHLEEHLADLRLPEAQVDHPVALSRAEVHPKRLGVEVRVDTSNQRLERDTLSSIETARFQYGVNLMSTCTALPRLEATATRRSAATQPRMSRFECEAPQGAAAMANPASPLPTGRAAAA